MARSNSRSQRTPSSSDSASPENENRKHEKINNGISDGGGINIAGERELGNVGGIDISARGRFGTEGLIPNQGVIIEKDVTNNTTKLGLGVGAPKGKLGANVGVTMGYDDEGNLEVKAAELGVNIAGFGGEFEVDDEGNTKLGISAGGGKVEIAEDSEGRRTVSLCYSVPGGEICVDFKPKGENGGKPNSSPPLGDSAPNIGFPSDEILPLLQDGACYHCVLFPHQHILFEAVWDPDPLKFIRDSLESEPHGQGVWENSKSGFYAKTTQLPYAKTPGFITNHVPPNCAASEQIRQPEEFKKYKINVKAWSLYNGSLQIKVEKGYRYNQVQPAIRHLVETGASLKNYIAQYKSPDRIWDLSVYQIPCRPENASPDLPKRIAPESPTGNNSSPAPFLPNTPNRIKKMDCCKEVKEIHKYLGIGKIKQKKLKLARQLLVAKGKGDIYCDDFYEIIENIIRMLANGTIINPISKPLGSDYQSSNATSWAAEMYEMMAESMSNGNSTQRFEMHAAAQLVQTMKVVAQLDSKVDFITEVLGILPKLLPSELSVLFTIHEAHKGFDKKKTAKEIDVSSAKTDDDVEKILGKMFKPSKIPYVKYTFDPNSISIAQAISKL